AARTLSVVGRVSLPAGAFRRNPPALPATTRTTRTYRRRPVRQSWRSALDGCDHRPRLGGRARVVGPPILESEARRAVAQSLEADETLPAAAAYLAVGTGVRPRVLLADQLQASVVPFDDDPAVAGRGVLLQRH